MQSFRKCALLIAHPGHEIRVHGWLETTKPVVYVLTDGSGRSGNSRLASTTRILDATGARAGRIFGGLPDRDFYQIVLKRDLAFFRQLTVELADEMVREQFDFVLGDAGEGEILTHDLWRSVIDAAVSNAERQRGGPIASYQFTLEGPPEPGPSEVTADALRLVLDDAALARKIAAARSYAELKPEVEQTLAAYGQDAFRLESFQCASKRAPARAAPPRYERHGEELVAAGIYSQPVRYAEHVAPILTELRRFQRAA